MQTIKALVSTGMFHKAPVTGITPAEFAILGKIHHKATNGEVFSELFDTGDALVAEPPSEPEGVPTYRPRTDAEELARLKQKYPIRGDAKTPGSNVIESLFPLAAGIIPKLPATFAELPNTIFDPVRHKIQNAVAKVDVAPEPVPIVHVTGQQVKDRSENKKSRRAAKAADIIPAVA